MLGLVLSTSSADENISGQHDLATKSKNSGLNGSRYSKMDQVKLVEDSLYKILLGPFLTTLAQIIVMVIKKILNTSAT